MKSSIHALAAVAVLISCSAPRQEQAETLDSANMKTELAVTEAPPILAFSPIDGYSVTNTLGMKDSVNFVLLNSQADLDKDFVYNNGVASSANPDFVINHIVAVATLPDFRQTTIGMEKVEIANGEINVYVTVARGKKDAIPSKAAHLFAIERRDGFTTMQFWVNGVKSTALILV
ncbi:MAG TPA: hypothetical protein PKM91_03855 [Cyclobacteriaceae bacterium]|jgi:hypothetical protein|nr:hypothetical protein [Cytophagales bacterium]HNP76345.1 hypothetical protein [Cyclobacteriaceae bacterium]HQQ84116.1 hypothetical protein [Cyclobacteriaceae bacterium]